MSSEEQRKQPNLSLSIESQIKTYTAGCPAHAHSQTILKNQEVSQDLPHEICLGALS